MSAVGGCGLVLDDPHTREVFVDLALVDGSHSYADFHLRLCNGGFGRKPYPYPFDEAIARY
jgi:hypothetical protein